jgi:putative ABC transport system permease protein
MPDGTEIIRLTSSDLLIASALVLSAGLVSLALRLRLETRLLFAATRTVLQLLLVGYALRWVFELDQAHLVVALLILMIALAGRAAVVRPSRTFRGAYLRAFSTLLLTGLLTTWAVTGAIIGVTPWYDPQYVIPLAGMVLGNSLTGISICLDALLESLSEQRARVETELALGASRWEAAREPLADAVRRGLIPIINAMMVVGLVSLPGMMTGQILSGTDPLEAVKYQIVVMFMIAAATSLGCITMAWLVYRRLFNERHQLRAELIERQG